MLEVTRPRTVAARIFDFLSLRSPISEFKCSLFARNGHVGQRKILVTPLWARWAEQTPWVHPCSVVDFELEDPLYANSGQSDAGSKTTLHDRDDSNLPLCSFNNKSKRSGKIENWCAARLVTVRFNSLCFFRRSCVEPVQKWDDRYSTLQPARVFAHASAS